GNGRRRPREPRQRGCAPGRSPEPRPGARGGLHRRARADRPRSRAPADDERRRPSAHRLPRGRPCDRRDADARRRPGAEGLDHPARVGPRSHLRRARERPLQLPRAGAAREDQGRARRPRRRGGRLRRDLDRRRGRHPAADRDRAPDGRPLGDERRGRAGGRDPPGRAGAAAPRRRRGLAGDAEARRRRGAPDRRAGAYRGRRAADGEPRQAGLARPRAARARDARRGRRLRGRRRRTRRTRHGRLRSRGAHAHRRLTIASGRVRRGRVRSGGPNGQLWTRCSRDCPSRGGFRSGVGACAGSAARYRDCPSDTATSDWALSGRSASIWIRGSHSSQLGRYQFQRPRICIAAGRRTERMIVASISSATATPKPICWNMTRSPIAKPVKTATMISAAPVIRRAVDATPWTRASVVEPVASKRSLIRLSRNTWYSIDRPKSTEKRKSGTHASIESTCWKPSSPLPTPCRKTRITSPYAAPTDSRLRTIEVAATTIERKTTVSRMKLSPSTKTNTFGSHALIASMKSTLSAVSPPTRTRASVPRNACGMSTSRRWRTASSAGSPVLSPPTSTPIAATAPSAEKRRSLRPNTGSAARRLRSRAIADRTSGDRTSPTTAISAGLELARGKSRLSASKPRFDSSRFGSVLTPLAPSSRPNAATAAAPSTPTATPRLATGRRITHRTIPPQKRPSSDAPRLRPANGMRRRSTPSPAFPSSAGSN